MTLKKLQHVNLIFVNGLLCVTDFGILMKRNSMTTCETMKYNQKTRSTRGGSSGDKVKNSKFFFFTVIRCTDRYV